MKRSIVFCLLTLFIFVSVFHSQIGFFNSEARAYNDSVSTISTKGAPSGGSFDAEGGIITESPVGVEIYVAFPKSNQVSVIDDNPNSPNQYHIFQNISIPYPHSMGSDQHGRIYVGSGDYSHGTSIFIIDVRSHRVMQTIPVSGLVKGFALLVVDISEKIPKITKTIDLGNDLSEGLAFDSSDGYLYILQPWTLYKINISNLNTSPALQPIISSLTNSTFFVKDKYLFEPQGATSIAFNNGDIYVTTNVRKAPCPSNVITTCINGTPPEPDYPCAEGSLLVINANNPNTPNKIIHTVSPLGKCPAGIAFSLNDKIYVTQDDLTLGPSLSCSVPGSVTVIDGKTFEKIHDVSVGRCPFGITFNSSTGNMYVANTNNFCVAIYDSKCSCPTGQPSCYLPATISVISTAAPIAFLTTSIIEDASGKNITGSSEPLGSKIHDTATIHGSLNGVHLELPAPVPTGTITYFNYINSQCIHVSGSAGAEKTVTIDSNGNVPAATSLTPNSPGTIGYRAIYSGDSNYPDGAVSDCERVDSMKPSVVTFFTDLVHQVIAERIHPGAIVNDNARIKGIVADKLTGTVTYQLYGGQGPAGDECMGNHSDLTVTISNLGTVPPDSRHFHTFQPGKFSYKAIYNGNYGIIQSDCEPLEVEPVVPIP